MGIVGGGHRSAHGSPHCKTRHQRRRRGHCWGPGRGEGVSVLPGEEGSLGAGRRGGLRVQERGLGKGLLRAEPWEPSWGQV